jgi:hypothetical protein
MCEHVTPHNVAMLGHFSDAMRGAISVPSLDSGRNVTGSDVYEFFHGSHFQQVTLSVTDEDKKATLIGTVATATKK